MVSHSRDEKDTWIGTNVKCKRLQSKDKVFKTHLAPRPQQTANSCNDRQFSITLIASIFNF